jgi:putative acetyltransferase
MSYQIRSVRSPQDIVVVRDLIREYIHWLDIDIATQGFEAELPHFPGRYSPPAGDLLLAQNNSGEALGCICLQPLELPGACEVKRLYVRPAARGMGLGRALATLAIERASTLGYREGDAGYLAVDDFCYCDLSFAWFRTYLTILE